MGGIRSWVMVMVLLSTRIAHAQLVDPWPAPPADPPQPSPAAPPPEPTIVPADPEPELLPARDDARIEVVPEEEIALPPPPYPRALVARPLVLPSGMLEAESVISVARVEASDVPLYATSLELHGRYALGPFELEAGTQAILGLWRGATIEDRERLAFLIVGARFALAPELSLGVQRAIEAPFSDASARTTRGVLEYKAQVSPTAAIQAAFAAGGADASFENKYYDESATFFVMTGDLRGQVQIKPLVGLELRAVAHVAHLVSEPIYGTVIRPDPGTTLAHNFGARFIASVVPSLDLSAGCAIITSNEPHTYVFSLGVALRNRP